MFQYFLALSFQTQIIRVGESVVFENGSYHAHNLFGLINQNLILFQIEREFAKFWFR